MTNDEILLYVVVPISRSYDIGIVRKAVEHVLSKHFRRLSISTWQLSDYSPDAVSITYEVKEDNDAILVTVKAVLNMSNIQGSVDKVCTLLYNRLKLFVHELTDDPDFSTIVVTPHDVNTESLGNIERLSKRVYEVYDVESLIKLIKMFIK